MAHRGPDHLQFSVQCTDTEIAMPTPVVPVSIRESRPGISCELMKCRAELDAIKQLIITEGKQREVQIGQAAKQLASLENKTEMAAINVYQQIDDLKRQMCSIEHGHDHMQQQLSQLQKTEKSLKSELMRFQSRVDDIQKNSSSSQITDLVNHLTTVKSEAEEGKARFEKHLELLERRIESIERSLKVEEIGQKLQKLQAETQRIENDVREDFKKDLEDFKQQILQECSFSRSAVDLEPAAMATTKGDHFSPIARSETEDVVMRRKQPVTSVDSPESLPSSGHSASMFADDSSALTTNEVKRASRASSGYYSVSSSRPTSMARSESNASLLAQRLSQFEFEVLKEEDGDPIPKSDDEGN